MEIKLPYGGASGKLTWDKAINKSGWFAQPKLDGIYVVVRVGADAKIHDLRTRNGKAVPRDVARDFLGRIGGYPHSILIGELECWTQRSDQLVQARGYRQIHLYDAIQIGGTPVWDRPYGERRHALYSMIGDYQESYGRDTPWYEDRHGRPHDIVTGDFRRRIPEAWKRLPVTPQVPAHRAGELWEEYVETGIAEGLVFINPKSKMGRGKAKYKLIESIDAQVVSVGKSAVVLREPDGREFTTPKKCAITDILEPGLAVEVIHEGRYLSDIPRFARISRHRMDLM